MTNRATLEALLARVLEGTGPDRELDGDLAEALQVGGNPWKHEGDGWISVHGFGCQAAMFTRSLDAALTLVPDGWTWARFHSGVFECAMLDDRRALFKRGDAATPARALIAACLKARMAQGE
ncbi:MAG: hypothetical protein ACK5X3_23185 [Pseudomonadota bacterium]